jgi:hypothetical protein
MPRTPQIGTERWLSGASSVDELRSLLTPLQHYGRCESAAFVRRALNSALTKDRGPLSPYAHLLPDPTDISLARGLGRSTCKFAPITSENDIKRAASESSAQLKKGRLFFEQARVVSDEIKPVLF